MFGFSIESKQYFTLVNYYWTNNLKAIHCEIVAIHVVWVGVVISKVISLIVYNYTEP